MYKTALTTENIAQLFGIGLTSSAIQLTHALDLNGDVVSVSQINAANVYVLASTTDTASLITDNNGYDYDEYAMPLPRYTKEFSGTGTTIAGSSQYGLDVSDDGRTLVTYNDIINVDTLTSEFTIPNYTFYTTEMSNDGTVVVRRSANDTIRIYQKSGGTWSELIVIQKADPDGWGIGITISGNGEFIACSGWHSTTAKILIYRRSGATWTTSDFSTDVFTYSLPNTLSAPLHRTTYPIVLNYDGTVLAASYDATSGDNKVLFWTRTPATNTWSDRDAGYHELVTGPVPNASNMRFSNDKNYFVYADEGWGTYGRVQVYVCDENGVPQDPYVFGMDGTSSMDDFGGTYNTSRVSVSQDGTYILVPTITGQDDVLLKKTDDADVWEVHQTFAQGTGTKYFSVMSTTSLDVFVGTTAEIVYYQTTGSTDLMEIPHITLGDADIVNTGSTASLEWVGSVSETHKLVYDTTAWAFTENYTKSLWMYVAATETSQLLLDMMAIFHEPNSTTGNRILQYDSRSGAYFRFVASDDIVLQWDYAIPVDTWIHIAMTVPDYDASNIILYVNGTPLTRTYLSTNYTMQAFTPVELYIGNKFFINSGSTDRKFYLDDISIFNATLNASQITELYQDGANNVTGASPYAYWRLEGTTESEMLQDHAGSYDLAVAAGDSFPNISTAVVANVFGPDALKISTATVFSSVADVDKVYAFTFDTATASNLSDVGVEAFTSNVLTPLLTGADGYKQIGLNVSGNSVYYLNSNIPQYEVYDLQDVSLEYAFTSLGDPNTYAPVPVVGGGSYEYYVVAMDTAARYNHMYITRSIYKDLDIVARMDTRNANHNIVTDINDNITAMNELVSGDAFETFSGSCYYKEGNYQINGYDAIHFHGRIMKTVGTPANLLTDGYNCYFAIVIQTVSNPGDWACVANYSNRDWGFSIEKTWGNADLNAQTRNAIDTSVVSFTWSGGTQYIVITTLANDGYDTQISTYNLSTGALIEESPTKTHTSRSIDGQTGTGVAFGNNVDGTGACAAYIGEIIFGRGELTASRRAQLVADLSNKWG
jgi:hypothetical protein